MKRLLLLTALLLAACHNSATGPGPTGPLTGHWKGTASDYAALDFTLTQTDTLLQGSGTVTGTVTEPMVVIGFFSSSSSATPIVMSYAVENAVPAVFLGALSQNGDSVSGTFYIDNGPADAVTFLRQ